jgi:hypothetical protein
VLGGVPACAATTSLCGQIEVPLDLVPTILVNAVAAEGQPQLQDLQQRDATRHQRLPCERQRALREAMRTKPRSSTASAARSRRQAR